MIESTTGEECERLFRNPLVPLPGSFCLLALYTGDLAMARFRLQELATGLAAGEKETSLLDEHAATGLPTETRWVIQCVIQDRLPPAIDDLLSFLVHPLDGNPGEVS